MLNLFGTIIAIVSGLLSSIQIITKFIKPDPNVKIHQHNENGNNINIDNSTHINASRRIIVNPDYNNSNNDLVIPAIFLIALVVLATMLAFYPMTYMLIPSFCILLLTINIYRDTKVSFESVTAKIQWALKNVIFLIVIFILLFTPKSILNIIDQIPEFHYESFQSVLDSLINNIKFINYYFGISNLLTLNLVGRMLVTFLLFIHLFQSSIAKRSIIKTYKTNDLLIFAFVTLLMLFGSNIEFFWNLVEPYRINIANWFNPPQ
ncbi:hypothetical protein [Lysinibacillus sp. Ag94]|uniref:hypothetical protein n=1 Tax=Lysinibacillus sp. Ag94 TaxID=2936682 RepID=UPI00200C9A8E|nr:hypothetical protein [Lysinibacillus sp. Ag94]UPW82661.1 hypothetical protein MY533_18375 [Lysinibacillus sp. Ag94]